MEFAFKVAGRFKKWCTARGSRIRAFSLSLVGKYMVNGI